MIATSAAVFTVEVDLYYFDLNNPGQLIPSSCIADFQKFTNGTLFEANVTSSLEESEYFMEGCAPFFKLDKVKLADVVGVLDSQNQVWFAYCVLLEVVLMNKGSLSSLGLQTLILSQARFRKP